MIAVDLSKQQALDADPKAIQQINFTANLHREGNTRFYFILEEAKNLFLSFHQYKTMQYNSLNLKVLNSQFSKLKSAIKNETEVILRLSSNMISGNETNFPH